jgi:hypothetical protein
MTPPRRNEQENPTAKKIQQQFNLFAIILLHPFGTTMNGAKRDNIRSTTVGKVGKGT